MLITLAKIATKLENDGHVELADQTDDIITAIAASYDDYEDEEGGQDSFRLSKDKEQARAAAAGPREKWKGEYSYDIDEDRYGIEPGQLYNKELQIQDTRTGDPHDPGANIDEEMEAEGLQEVGAESVGLGTGHENTYSAVLFDHAAAFARYIRGHASSDVNEIVDELHAVFHELAAAGKGIVEDEGFKQALRSLVLNVLQGE